MLSAALAGLAAWIVSVISAGGYAGVAALMAIESACIPLPSEIIMPFAGYLVSTGRFNLFAAATAGAVGCNLGSTLAYYVVGRGGEPLLRRWGWIILVTPEEIGRAERFFARFGSATVLIGRVLPVVRTYIAVPAGLAKMPQLKFQIYTFVGSWVWCVVLAYIGERLGRAWNTNPALRDWLHRFDFAVVAVLALLFLAFLWSRIRRVRGTAG